MIKDIETTQDVLKKLNSQEIIRNHIHDYISVFVEYYGEEERSFIEERFNNAVITGYLTDDDLKRMINTIKENISNEIFDKIIKSTSLNVTKEMLFGDYIFEYSNIFPITKYEKFYNENKKTKEERYQEYIDESYKSLLNYFKDFTKEEFEEMVNTKKLPERFKDSLKNVEEFVLEFADTSYFDSNYNRLKKDAVKFLSNIDSTVTIDNIEKKVNDFNEINDLFTICREAENVYNQRLQEFQKYIDMYEHNSSIKESLDEKYLKVYREYVYKFIPKSMLDLTREKKSNGEKASNEEISIDTITGFSISHSGLIDYFSSDVEAKLNNQNTADWEIDTIKNKRIEYFKNIGFYLGNDYDKYLDKKDIWPNCNDVDKLLEIKDEILNMYNKEYYNSRLSQIQMKQDTEKKEFLDKNIAEACDVYMSNNNQGATCICPNIIFKNGNYEPSGSVYINADVDDIDHKIIHELNHLYELSIISVEQPDYRVTCGWDITNGKIGIYTDDEAIKPDSEKRPYELFNEIINEKIAKEITNIMEERNIYIFNNKEEENNHRTGYDTTNYIVDEFFKKYKKEIIQSRKDNNIQILYDSVGKENFDALNDLFKIHNDNFSGLNIYGLYEDLKNNKDTKRTRIYDDICRKRDEVLVKMEECYLRYKSIHKSNNR